ncbi:TniQ family protein [Shimia sp. R9_3]|nr:TniQ family protein [Shimia sp. R9_3]
MIEQLALTSKIVHLETPASLVSRVSRINFSVPREWCSDLGLRWTRICSAYPDQFWRLSRLTGVLLEQLTFNAPVQIGPCRYRVGHSSATNGTMLRAITRICPQCVLETLEQAGSHGGFQRLDWLVLPIGTCAKHGVPLLKLPNALNTHRTYDVVQQVSVQRV